MVKHSGILDDLFQETTFFLTHCAGNHYMEENDALWVSGWDLDVLCMRKH